MVEVTLQHTSRFLIEVAKQASMTVEITGWQLNDNLLHMNAIVYGGDFEVFEAGLDVHDLAQFWETLSDFGNKRQYWIAAHPSIKDREGVGVAESHDVFLKKSIFEPSWENWKTVIHGSDKNSRRVIDELDDIGLSPKIEAANQNPKITAGPLTFPDDILSDKQREIITIALELGYFDVPRETTLDEIANEVGISASAASKRLVRAQQKLFSLLSEG